MRYSLLTLLLILISYSATYSAVVKNNESCFIENKGQVTDQYYNKRKDIDFKLSTGKGLNIFISSGKIYYQFYRQTAKSEESTPTWNMDDSLLDEGDIYAMSRVEVELIGANDNAKLIVGEKQDYYENYLHNASNVIKAYTYNKVVYKNIYPNIDWVLKVNGGELKHEFVIHKGGDASKIKIKYSGTSSLQLNPDGSFIAFSSQGSIKEAKPIVLKRNGEELESAYNLERNILGYRIEKCMEEYIIDPVIEWGTYYGGIGTDESKFVKVDASGSVIFSGNTSSVSNIATTGSFQTVNGGGGDIFLVKFNSSGARLWGTYIGGQGRERCTGISLDRQGNLYLAAEAGSSNMATSNAFQVNKPSNASAAFFAKFNNAGSLIWSTYYGGSSTPSIYGDGIAADFHGGVYFLAHSSSSGSNVTTANAHQQKHSSGGTGADVFLARFDSSGNRLWGTYYGGKYSDYPKAITVDKNSNVYFGGFTSSYDSIATPNAYQTAIAPASWTAFLVKFDTSGKRSWGTYYGGDENDFFLSLAVDNNDNIIATGHGYSDTGVASLGSHQQILGSGNGASDAYLVKFNSSGVRLWGTYYGSSRHDEAASVVVDSFNNIYMFGKTESTSAISTVGSYQPVKNWGPDAFLAKFDENGVRLWGTYYGGDKHDDGTGIAIKDCWSYYLTGFTRSSTSIATTGAYKTSKGLDIDAFLVKMNDSTLSNVSIVGDNKLCLNSKSAYQANLSGGKWVSLKSRVSFSQDGIATGVSIGADTIIYEIYSSCKVVKVKKAIEVIAKPITNQPVGIAVTEDKSAQFKIQALGSNTTYQWQTDDGTGFKDLNNNTTYAGVYSSSLSISLVTQLIHNNKYRCIVNTDNCNDTSADASLLVWSLSIENNIGRVVEIYPNPAKKSINVSMLEDIKLLEVNDMLGRTIMYKVCNSNIVELNISELNNGIYFLRINNKQVGKFVKE